MVCGGYGNPSANTALSPSAANCRPHRRQIRRRRIAESAHTPVPPWTIPAKAGISQCRATNNAVFAHNRPYTSRPFLRRQESQRATPFPRRIWRHDTVRFLPTQEWSPGEWECVCGFWHCWAAIWRLCTISPPSLQTFLLHC